MATHSSILAWRIPRTEEPGRLQSVGSQESDMTKPPPHSHTLNIHIYLRYMGFPGGLERNLPAMQETWVRFPGQEDHLEKGMATHSSVLAWKIPWAEKPGGLQSMGSQKSQT